MKHIDNILCKYTSGEASLEETNAALAQEGAAFRLEADPSVLTPEAQAAGYGLLDTGTGSFDKVKVENGHLVDCDCGSMKAFVLFSGKVYAVRGRELVEPEQEISPDAFQRAAE